MNGRRNPFSLAALVSGCYEFVLALFIFFQILLAVLVLEVAKVLPIGWPFSWSRHTEHNSFCAGHFPPFSPCRERDNERLLATARTPTRFSRGSALGKAFSNVSTSRRAAAGLSVEPRSSPSPASCRSKHRFCSTSKSGCTASRHNVPIDSEFCRCICPSLDIYDDLIEVSSEYLKQKDRGHEEVILSLLKALQAERKNLRTLYEELDEERVASETAANEAMSMILRLQEEKSALQIEADHYQRMAEEKANHDEHAIRFLEEDLCKKENDRLLLEEEIMELRRRLYPDNDEDCDIAENPEISTDGPLFSERHFLLTDGSDDATKVEQEVLSATRNQRSESLQCASIFNEESCDGSPSWEVTSKRLKRESQSERIGDAKELLVVLGTLESVCNEPNRNSQLSDEIDTEAILNQLSAVEKQLSAFEECEKLELWQQAQASQNSLIRKFLSPAACSGSHFYDNCESSAGLEVEQNTTHTSEVDCSTMFDEKRVVKVDVANVVSGQCKMHASGSDEILEIPRDEYQRSKFVQWEASEEEKHLDLLSCVKKSTSYQASTSRGGGEHKPVSEEESWNVKTSTLEMINLQLQALERENTTSCHHSAPSNCDNVNLVLLKEIMQELQELLRDNKNVSDESLLSTGAYVKST